MNISAYRKKIADYFDKANVVLTEYEKENIEIASFGLNELERFGLQLVTYVNNERYCAKEMVLLPDQVCPEHKHPTRSDGSEGKKETFRCRYGEVHLFIEDKEVSEVEYSDYGIKDSEKEYFTATKKVVLKPGEQYTIEPDLKHWFAAKSEGAVISEFSSNSEDETDIFTDPRVDRKPE